MLAQDALDHHPELRANVLAQGPVNRDVVANRLDQLVGHAPQRLVAQHHFAVIGALSRERVRSDVEAVGDLLARALQPRESGFRHHGFREAGHGQSLPVMAGATWAFSYGFCPCPAGVAWRAQVAPLTPSPGAGSRKIGADAQGHSTLRGFVGETTAADSRPSKQIQSTVLESTRQRRRGRRLRHPI